MAREARASPKTSDEFPIVLQFLLSLPATHILRRMHVHTASLYLLRASIGRRPHLSITGAVAPHLHCPLSLIRPQYGTPHNVFVRISSCQYCSERPRWWPVFFIPRVLPDVCLFGRLSVYIGLSRDSLFLEETVRALVHMVATLVTHGKDLGINLGLCRYQPCGREFERMLKVSEQLQISSSGPLYVRS